ncbi:MAG: fumarylacetoacetate hydrolase family protein, partial [Planctomycetaceae bacterium]|nr:fumarylacetoacetate hydrolase family protein [Planctomycetaceae bacterium]
MRLCRYTQQNQTQAGLYDETSIVSLAAAAEAYRTATKDNVQLAPGDNLLDYLPHGTHAAAAAKVAAWAAQNRSALAAVSTPTSSVQLHMPIPRPNKLFLLAGNYAEHIREGGGVAAERAETFPYVFMKPPSTTLIDPGATVKIPRVSPGAIDWELELAVVIGQRCKH